LFVDELRKPEHSFLDYAGVQLIVDEVLFFVLKYEVSFFQLREMIGYRRGSQVEMSGYVSGGHAALLSQKYEYVASDVVGQRFEGFGKTQNAPPAIYLEFFLNRLYVMKHQMSRTI
jgi:hypothetical protein